MLRERLKIVAHGVYDTLHSASVPMSIKAKGTINTRLSIKPVCGDRTPFVLELCACGWMAWHHVIGPRIAADTRGGKAPAAIEWLVKQAMEERDQHQPNCRDFFTGPAFAPTQVTP